MTIDETIEREKLEAIAHCDMATTYHTYGNAYSRAEEAYKAKAEYHAQIAEWLKELKQLKLREQTRWIPVSERLPKFGKKVLVHIINVDNIEYDVACLKDTKHTAYDENYYWSGKFAYGLKSVIEWKLIESEE